MVNRSFNLITSRFSKTALKLKPNHTSEGVMDFLGAIVKISKAIDKAQEKPLDLKNLLRSLA